MKTVTYSMILMLSCLQAQAQSAPQSMISSQARVVEEPLLPPSPEPTPEPSPEPAGLITCLLAPARVANIASPITGLVETVKFKRSDTVETGAVLVQLDDRVAQSDLDLARIARQGLADKLQRAETLEKTKIISRDEIESLRTDYATAQAQVARAELLLDMTRISAPFSGVIANVLVEEGEVVGTANVMQLIDISTLRVELTFGRAAFGTMQVGANLNVAVDLVSKTVPATITSVDPFLDASSNTFSVLAAVSNADLSLPAGANCSLAP